MNCSKMWSSPYFSPGTVVLLALLSGAIPVELSAEDLYVEGEITTHLARDIDGDGWSELLVSYHRDERRYLAVFRGAKTYSRAPERVLPVDPQAVLFAVGDYESTPGLELVLVSRSSGVTYPLGSAASPGAYRRLFKTRLFFTLPSVTALPSWLSRRPLDLDGDGREDFVLPESHRLRLLMKRKDDQDDDGDEGRWGHDQELPINYYLLGDSSQRRMRTAIESFANANSKTTNLLEAAGAFPFPVFADFDGDGRTDIIVKQFGSVLEVFEQRPAGVFPARPSMRVALDWADGVSSMLIEDIDGDGKLDLLASKLLVKNLATEIKVFLQDPASEGRGFLRPRQLLRVSGFFSRPKLGDANKDGRPDLLVATYRLDLLDQLKPGSADKLEITYQVFLGATRTPFRRRPDFKREFQLETTLVSGRRNRPSIYIGNDVTGDGRSDILFVDRARWLRLYRALEGGAIRYEESTDFATRVRDPRSVSLFDLDRRAGMEVVLEYPRFLQVLRYRR